MITVNEIVEQFCKDKFLPAPSINDKNEIGKAIAGDFGKNWTINNFRIGDMISDSGYKISEQSGKKITVRCYPDGFKENMIKVIDWFYTRKADNVKRDRDQKKQPVFSSRASNKIKQPENRRERIPVRKYIR